MTMMLPHDEVYFGFEIYIEPNPDRYREGVSWYVYLGGEEVGTGLDFEVMAAQKRARIAIDRLLE